MDEEILMHLKWIYGRMVKIHGENENVDYMRRFKEIIDDSESPCEWKLESDEWSTWATGCKSSFAFTEGNIEDNSLEYCPYCGHKIKEI